MMYRYTYVYKLKAPGADKPKEVHIYAISKEEADKQLKEMDLSDYNFMFFYRDRW